MSLEQGRINIIYWSYTLVKGMWTGWGVGWLTGIVGLDADIREEGLEGNGAGRDNAEGCRQGWTVSQMGGIAITAGTMSPSTGRIFSQKTREDGNDRRLDK